VKKPIENAISIRDFAKTRNQDADTVLTWIRRHPEVSAHCFVEGKDKYIELDTEGYTLLDIQYPLPKPIEVVTDYESRNKLLEAQNIIIQLQEQIREQAVQIAEQKATQLLLEDRTAQLKAEQEAHNKDKEQAIVREQEAKEQTERERQRADEAERKLEEAEKRAKASEEQVNKMKNSGFFARIFKKGWT